MVIYDLRDEENLLRFSFREHLLFNIKCDVVVVVSAAVFVVDDVFVVVKTFQTDRQTRSLLVKHEKFLLCVWG